MIANQGCRQYHFPIISLVFLLLSFALIAALLPCSKAWAADTTPPTTPSNLIAVQGTGTSIDLSWNPASDPESGIDHYRIYRSDQLIDSGNKDLAELLSGDVATTTYTDFTGIPGETYYYAVAAVNGDDLESGASNSPSQTVPTGPNPHVEYDYLSNFCRDCHSVHLVPSGAKIIMRKAPETDVCYVCHDGTGSVYNIQVTNNGLAAHDTQVPAPTTSNVKCMNCHYPHGTGNDLMTRESEQTVCFTNGCHDNTAHNRTTSILFWNVYNQFQLPSHHDISSATGAKVECTSCHGPHTVKYSPVSLDKISNPDNTYKLASTGGTGISNMTDFCLKCHDGTPPAQTVGSPLTFVPFTVVFPGGPGGKWNKSNFTNSAHASLTISNPNLPMTCDNINCHNPHGSSYTNLLNANEENVCYGCHNNSSNSEHSINIQQLFTTGTATWTGQVQSGYYKKVNTRHDISSSDQTWSATKIECGNCHSSHLDTRPNPFVDPDNRLASWTQTRNDPIKGTVLDSISFCLKCHDNTWAADSSVTGPVEIKNISTTYLTEKHGDGAATSGKTYLNGYYQNYPRMLCTDCHDSHGGGGIYHLKTLTDQYGTPITIADPASHDVAHWCSHCHQNPMGKIDGTDSGCISGNCHLHGTANF